MKYKKILATVGSVLMLGATMAGAFAASYPTPFSSEGAVVVVGANAASTDMVAATSINSDLTGKLVASTGSVSVEGGDSFQLEKSSDKFYFNEALNSSYATLDADELEMGLADGVYDSGDVEDVDYEQSITLGSNLLSLFSDTKYQNKEPTVGFKFANANNVLSYTIDFDDSEANLTKMPESDMPLLGSAYYVLTATSTKIELLDSANTVILEQDAETTVNGKVVSINWIDGTSDEKEVILNVDGTNVKKLSEGGVAQLSDGSYVAIKNILSSSRESTTQKVEFSIGSGKIILENGKEVIIGEDSDDKVRGLWATVTSDGTYLNGVTLAWNSKDTTFLTQANPLEMPGLGVISLVYNGLTYASDSETISLNGGSETLTLEMGNFNIPLMWYNGSAYVQGEEQYPLKIAASAYTYADAGYANGSVMTWEAGAKVNTTNLTTNALSVTEDDRFIVTLIDEDLSDVETLYYQVSEIDVDGADVLVELEDLIGSNDLTWDGTIVSKVGDTDEAGDVTVTLAGFNSANDTVYLEFTNGVVFNKVVSEKGLVVTIPTAAENAVLSFMEADKDDDVNQGVMFAATVTNTTNDKLSVTLASNNVSKEETLSDEKYIAVVKSELATKISTDESGDEYNLEIEYFGEEAVADVRVAVGSTTSVGEVGTMVATDAETSKITGKNLIVVGGSCINAIAAELVGSAACGEAFTTAKGVSAGQFLIESFAREGKVALLVAGYDAADTTKAATYLVNNDVDTAVGAKTIKSSTVVADVE